MASVTVANGGGNYSASTTWDVARLITAADDVVVTGTSGQLTIDQTTNDCRSADFTGYTGTLSFTASKFLNIGTATTGPAGLALRFIPGQVLSFGASSRIQFVSTTTGNLVTWAGASLSCLLVFNGVGGGWTLQDAMTLTANLSLSAGTLDTNGQTITTSAQFSSSNPGVTRVLTLGTTTINSSNVGSAWTMAGSALTINATSSTLNFSGATVTFAGGGFTYGTVNFTGTGTDIITGANTFTALSRSNAAACALTLPASVTTTVTTVTLVGTPGNILTLASSTGGTAAPLVIGSGTVRFNHCSIKDLACSGGATFEAYDCKNVSGNTGITFKSPATLGLCGVG